MKSRRFLLALLVAGSTLSGTMHAMATPIKSIDLTADKNDPPRPKPKPGPRDGDDRQ